MLLVLSFEQRRRGLTHTPWCVSVRLQTGFETRGAVTLLLCRTRRWRQRKVLAQGASADLRLKSSPQFSLFHPEKNQN